MISNSILRIAIVVRTALGLTKLTNRQGEEHQICKLRYINSIKVIC